MDATASIGQVRQAHRVAGLDLGRTMTLVKLSGGGLWVHSPLPLQPEVIQALTPWGQPTHLVGPNLVHHMFLGQFQQAFPQSQTWLAPGLEQKRPDLACQGILGQDQAPWQEEIDLVVIQGMPKLREVAFFHKASQSLILCDLMLYPGGDGLWPKFYRMISGIKDQAAPSVLIRLLIKDRVATAQSLAQIAKWDFRQIHFSHGPCLREGAKEHFLRSLAWILP